MNSKKVILALLAVSLFIAIFIWQGIEPVMAKLTSAGWPLIFVCIFVVPVVIGNSEAWRVLFPIDRRPPVLKSAIATWVGSAVNTLLPVATIGGSVAKARILNLWGYPALDVISTVVVDKTVRAIVAAMLGMVGIVLLAILKPGDQRIIVISLMMLLLIIGIAGFIAAQLYGGFPFVARIAAKYAKSDRVDRLVAKAANLDSKIRLIYAKPGTVFISCLICFAVRLSLVGELLLAAHLMGQPIGLVEAIVIKILALMARDIAFAIPGQLGVQEAAYIGLGVLFGYPPDLMLAISLAVRLREILPSVPMIFVWQIFEARHLGIKN